MPGKNDTPLKQVEESAQLEVANQVVQVLTLLPYKSECLHDERWEEGFMARGLRRKLLRRKLGLLHRRPIRKFKGLMVESLSVGGGELAGLNIRCPATERDLGRRRHL